MLLRTRTENFFILKFEHHNLKPLTVRETLLKSNPCHSISFLSRIQVLKKSKIVYFPKAQVALNFSYVTLKNQILVWYLSKANDLEDDGDGSGDKSIRLRVFRDAL